MAGADLPSYPHLLCAVLVVRGRAVSVDGRRVRLASGEVLQPDYLVLATGSAYPFPGKTGQLDVARVRARYRAAHRALASAERALILGAARWDLSSPVRSRRPSRARG